MTNYPDTNLTNKLDSTTQKGILQNENVQVLDHLSPLHRVQKMPPPPQTCGEQVSVRSLMTEAGKQTPDSIKPALFTSQYWRTQLILWAANCFILLDETHTHTSIRRTVTPGSVSVGCDGVHSERAWLWQDALTLSVVAARPLSAVPEWPVVTKALTDLRLTLRHIYSTGYIHMNTAM